MSNQAVGNVYQTIIDEVINSSRVDFDESGVEESVLEELRQVSPSGFPCCCVARSCKGQRCGCLVTRLSSP
jgi:hypothetical protein